MHSGRTQVQLVQPTRTLDVRLCNRPQVFPERVVFERFKCIFHSQKGEKIGSLLEEAILLCLLPLLRAFLPRHINDREKQGREYDVKLSRASHLDWKIVHKTVRNQLNVVRDRSTLWVTRRTCVKRSVTITPKHGEDQCTRPGNYSAMCANAHPLPLRQHFITPLTYVNCDGRKSLLRIFSSGEHHCLHNS